MPDQIIDATGDLPLKEITADNVKTERHSPSRFVIVNGIVTYRLRLQHGRAEDKLLREDL